MIELVLSALALLNAILCVFGIPTWGTACAYWSILTAVWAVRAAKKAEEEQERDRMITEQIRRLKRQPRTDEEEKQ